MSVSLIVYMFSAFGWRPVMSEAYLVPKDSKDTFQLTQKPNKGSASRKWPDGYFESIIYINSIYCYDQLW